MANPRTNPGLLPPSQLEFLSKGICLSIRKWLLPVGTSELKKCSKLQVEIHPIGGCSMNLSTSPPTSSTTTKFQAWKMHALSRLGAEVYRIWLPILLPLQIPGVWTLEKPHFTGRVPPMTAASRLFQRMLRWQEYFPVEIYPFLFASESWEHSWWKSRQHDIVWTLKARLILLWLVLPLAHT